MKVELMPMPLANFHEPLPKVLYYNPKSGNVTQECEGASCLAFQTNVFYVDGLRNPKQFIPPAVDV